MTYEDITNEIKKEIILKKEQREKDVKKVLDKLLSESEYNNEISETKITFRDSYYNVSGSDYIYYYFKLINGYEKHSSCLWMYHESIKQVCNKIKKEIINSIKIIKQYPEYITEYITLNAHMTKFRMYEKECYLSINGNIKKITIQTDLCSYLNEFEYPSELKYTLNRMKDFNSNIDKLCEFFINCITELKEIKIKKNGKED